MSFTLEVTAELLSAGETKTCCKKALLYGLFFGARRGEGENTVWAEFRTEEAARLAEGIMKKQFSAETLVTPRVYAGRRQYLLTASTKAVSAYVRALDDEGDERDFSAIVGYRCKECPKEFLRGVFIACAKINDPRKSYHLEFSALNSVRAKRLCSLLSAVVPQPKTVARGTKVGVYYKSNEAIFDLMNYIGGGQSRFALTNAFIERDIRNAENRATNCVARNISKSVDASRKQILAIESLVKSGKLVTLPEELRYTATLRLENPSASLIELSHLHEPPISKSGLNRRLKKIMEEAEEANAEE